MTRVLYPEWRDQFETTKYPFAATAALRNATGQTLLEGMLLDAQLYPVGGQARLYLARVTLDNATLVFTLGDETTAELATGTVDLNAIPDEVALVDGYGRPAGILVSERVRLAAFLGWGVGSYEFLPAQTEFAATCCMPTPEVAVRGLLLDDGQVVAGQAWIVGDDGVVVRRETVVAPATCAAAAAAVDVVRVDIIGDPLFRRRLCADGTLFAVPRPVRALRVVNGDYVFETAPQQGGDITLQVNNGLASDPVLRIRVTADGLLFETIGSVQRTDGSHDVALALPPSYGV